MKYVHNRNGYFGGLEGFWGNKSPEQVVPTEVRRITSKQARIGKIAAVLAILLLVF